MTRALTVTLIVWALCAYGMFALRKSQLPSVKVHTQVVYSLPERDFALKQINHKTHTIYDLSPTWIARGRMDLQGDPAMFEVMFIAVPEKAEGAHELGHDASFLGRMFITWRGKTYDVIDDTEYAGDLIAANGNYYLRWRMPGDLQAGMVALLATLPDGPSSHFLIQKPDATWAQSSYIQWEKISHTEWHETFDRNLASVDEAGL